jgi:hypothetical protein
MVVRAQIVESGLFTDSRKMYNALQYGVRKRIFVSKKRTFAAKQNERFEYSLSSDPFPTEQPTPCVPSFELLQAAWGLALVAPQLTAVASRVFVLAHDERI